jgi:enoyl-CoA hydratase/carnithine racemase
MIASQVIKQFSTQKTINNIDIHSNGKVAKVILNKPKALNSLSLEMVIDVKSQL